MDKNVRNEIKIETNFIQKQHVFDAALENLSFTVSTGSSDEDCDTSDDDSNMSGVDVLEDDLDIFGM